MSSIGITQVIRRHGSTEVRRLPGWVLNGFHGLRGFLRLRVVNKAGKTVAFQRLTFCPDTYDPERATPDSPADSPYPQHCGSGGPSRRARSGASPKAGRWTPAASGSAYRSAQIGRASCRERV